jgi:Tfp pilus assembly protein PilO
MVSYKQQLQQTENKGLTKDYFSILASLALLILLILVIYPAIKHIAEINKEISDARVIKAGLEAKLDALAQARTNYDEVKNDLGVLDLALPVGSNLPPYLKSVEDLSSKSGLKISNAQFNNVPLTKTAKTTASLQTTKISYKITLDGGFTNFEQFLVSLEKFIRVSDVTGIDITKGDQSKNGQSSTSGTLTESLGIDTYFLGAPTTTTTTTSTSGGKTQ